MNDTPLKTGRDLRLPVILSAVIGLLMAGASLGGLLMPDGLYPGGELRQTYLPNDVVNLFIGLPVLLVSMRLAWRGSLAGLLLWPGALLYVLYNYIAYIFGIPSSLVTLAYAVLVLLSGVVIIVLLISIDLQAVRAYLEGDVPVKTAGWVLVVFGGFFIFRAVDILAGSVSDLAALPAFEIGVLVADVALSLLWFGGGILLLLRKPLGYASGLGLLFAGCMLFVSLIVFLLLQPLLTDAPFSPVDVLVVAVMGLICFIPFGMYLRGAQLKGILA